MTVNDTAPWQRIDKWLWHARVARTRSQAAALVAAGRVRVNRVRVTKAGHPLRTGDVVTVAVARGIRVLRVEDFAERRGSAEAARALYTDLSPEQPPPAASMPARPAGAGRPTKRERRALEGWKHGIAEPERNGE